MANIEDNIINQMTQENIGFNEYSQMNPMERATTAQPVYQMFLDQYQGRDTSRYGRLSFEDYISGLRPEETYIASLMSEVPTKEAIAWSETFGEDTPLMKEAAFDYGKKFDAGYPEANNNYNQGE